MSDVDQKKLMEILRLARSSLNEELMKRQHEAYQAWQVSALNSWQSNGMLLPPYNIKLVYPTEQDIVKKALEIYNTLTPPAALGAATSPTTASEPANIIPPEDTVNNEKPLVDAVATPAEETKIEDTTAQDSIQPESTETTENKFKSLLTKWGGRGTF
jgi:hypothetical protein